MDVGGTCRQQSKCGYGQLCVTPGDTCAAFPAPPQGSSPGPGECYALHPSGRTFLVCNQAATWSEALGYCRGYGGYYLARISSDEEEAAIGNLLSGGAAWLGLNDQVTSGTYAWSDGAPFNYGSTLHQAPWCGAAPTNNPATPCIAFVASSTLDCWDEADCADANHGIICSR